MAAYVPSQGDFVVLSFDPQAGHEQMGRRPALVVSVDAFNNATRLAFCCPITNTDRKTAFHVSVPKDSGLTGFVMCEQMKSIDYRARKIKPIGSAPKEFLDEVLSVIDACIYPGPEPAVAHRLPVGGWERHRSQNYRLPLNAMNDDLIPLENFFAATLEETLDEWPATMTEIAHATGIPLPHLSGMKSGKRRCTPEYDLRLSRYFGTSRGYWMRLQLSFDMDRTQRLKGTEIDRSVPVAAGQ